VAVKDRARALSIKRSGVCKPKGALALISGGSNGSLPARGHMQEVRLKTPQPVPSAQQPEQQRKNNADHNAGGERKVKNRILPR